ncbi:synaptogenesis protein syg-2-like isoform X2 [Tachypleus tridentatus]|uniref:synaptogenesis protein syg-2-like isoform X2 n=1 Tax=Tachypleus tridentatus TaxID=6853 RepID=UPI003FD4E1EC
MSNLQVTSVYFMLVTIRIIFAGTPGIKLKPTGTSEGFSDPFIIEVMVGRQVELPCDIRKPTGDDSVSLILWYKSDINAPIFTVDSRHGPLEKAEHFSSDTLGLRASFNLVVHPAILTIDPVKETDDGEYRCRVDYRWARTIHRVIDLKVIVPVKEILIVNQRNQSLSGIVGPYSEGSELTLVCYAVGGKPIPSVTWWMQSVLVDNVYGLTVSGNVRNDLILEKLSRDDFMINLTCRASNSNHTSTVSASVTIDMNLRPTNVKISTKRRQFSANKEYNVECQTTGSKPPARITWWKGSTHLTTATEMIPVHGNTTLSILTFMPSRWDNGKYLSCRVDNPFVRDSALEDGLTLNVTYTASDTTQSPSQSFSGAGDD